MGWSKKFRISYESKNGNILWRIGKLFCKASKWESYQQEKFLKFQIIFCKLFPCRFIMNGYMAEKLDCKQKMPIEATS